MCARSRPSRKKSPQIGSRSYHLAVSKNRRLRQWAGCASWEGFVTGSKYGSAQIAGALTHRNDTGCYKVVFLGLGEQLHIPAVERLAISALDDASVEVARDAADSLAKFGSARAESALRRHLALQATAKVADSTAGVENHQLVP